MTHRFTRSLSAIVLTLTMALTASPLASTMEPMVPNRLQVGGSGGSSVVLACKPAFLTESASASVSALVHPPSIHTSMLVLEQDHGAMYVVARDLSGFGKEMRVQSGSLADTAASDCLLPA